MITMIQLSYFTLYNSAFLVQVFQFLFSLYSVCPCKISHYLFLGIISWLCVLEVFRSSLQIHSPSVPTLLSIPYGWPIQTTSTGSLALWLPIGFSHWEEPSGEWWGGENVRSSVFILSLCSLWCWLCPWLKIRIPTFSLWF